MKKNKLLLCSCLLFSLFSCQSQEATSSSQTSQVEDSIVELQTNPVNKISSTGVLIDIAVNAKELGLSLCDIALLFKVPNGLAELAELIDSQKRNLDLVSLVIKTFKEEQSAMNSLSARDLYFLLRGTELSPSLEELINTFELLAMEDIGVLNVDKKASPVENTTYSMKNELQKVNRMRTLASAIEKDIIE